MPMPTQYKITLELDAGEAMALAQFLKRVGWSEVRACAVDNDEAYMIRHSLSMLRSTLNDMGFDPR